MIYGVGVDIIRIARIASVVQRKREVFENRVLGEQEMRQYLQRKAKLQVLADHFLAGRFAVKEAFSKALGLGMRRPMTWRGVQTINNANGKPIIITGPDLKKYMEERKIIAHVSITDEVEYSVAFVTLESY